MFGDLYVFLHSLYHLHHPKYGTYEMIVVPETVLAFHQQLYNIRHNNMI